mmetsp:Transcript_68505/g.198748  ORF Transcript_68505/g.198748 Transcript_68505/m.198748 type:complete len:200 (+) Transcript_68505:1318-1917(+)
MPRLAPLRRSRSPSLQSRTSDRGTAAAPTRTSARTTPPKSQTSRARCRRPRFAAHKYSEAPWRSSSPAPSARRRRRTPRPMAARRCATAGCPPRSAESVSRSVSTPPASRRLCETRCAMRPLSQGWPGWPTCFAATGSWHGRKHLPRHSQACPSSQCASPAGRRSRRSPGATRGAAPRSSPASSGVSASCSHRRSRRGT